VKQIRKRLTYANVMSTIAVFFVLGGATAFAASQLGKDTVGSKQLKANSVTAGKIKNGAVTPSKISVAAQNALRGASGATGPAGPAGPKGATGSAGPAGPQGEPGTARAYALVNGSTGAVSLGFNIETSNINHLTAGAYCISGLSFTPKNVVATPESPGGNFDPEVGIGAPPSSCPAPTQVRVFFRNSAGTLTDKNFFVLLN
jgi:hypothetical protein